MNQKKFFSILLSAACAIILTVASAFTLSACGSVYHSKAGTMNDLTGTYQLTTYTQKDNGNLVDRIKQWNVKAYLVVGADGHGYYYYQDDNTAYWYDTVLINYNHDDDDTNLYKSIQYTKGVSDRDAKVDRQKPGNGYEPTMGFNAKNKTLSYLTPDYTPSKSWIYPTYYTDVVYTKISKDTDLTKVAKDTGRDLAPLPAYELKNLNGRLVFHAGQPNIEAAERAGEPEKANNPLYNKYKYYVLDFNAVTKTANIYYQLTTDNEEHVELNVAIETNVIDLDDGRHQLTLKLFDQIYTAAVNFGNAPISANYEVNTKQYPDENGNIVSSQVYGNSIQGYYVNSSVQDVIDAQLAEYNRTANN